MNIPTIEDYHILKSDLESKMDLILEELAYLREEKIRMLNKQEICVRLKIAPATFRYRILVLVEFGMFKIGSHWRMKESDLNTYIESNKTFN